MNFFGVGKDKVSSNAPGVRLNNQKNKAEFNPLNYLVVF